MVKKNFGQKNCDTRFFFDKGVFPIKKDQRTQLTDQFSLIHLFYDCFVYDASRRYWYRTCEVRDSEGRRDHVNYNGFILKTSYERKRKSMVATDCRSYERKFMVLPQAVALVVS